MKATLKPSAIGAFLSLLLLCSCATTPQPPPQPPAIITASDLPADVNINKDAGRGGLLYVTLRLGSGEELPFYLDTGAPISAIDKSLEPQLGKCLGQSSINWWNGKEQSRIYAAPKLYLGNKPLATASKIFTSDFKRIRWHTMGVLGMDCLRHYCIQLDFAAGKLCFLDPDHLNSAGLGKAFPLTFSYIDPQRRFIRPSIPLDGLIGDFTNVLIDTGCTIDGVVSKGAIKGSAVLLSDCVWDGETFTNLVVAAVDHVDHVNVLGLSFLARHLVTLDFPNRTMYLKQTSIGPLAGDILKEISHHDLKAMVEAYDSLNEKGQLPGLSKNDKGAVYLEKSLHLDSQSVNAGTGTSPETKSGAGPESVTFGFQRSGDSLTHHYQVSRAFEDSPWKLEKTWRTDQNERTDEEYPAP